MVGPHLTGNSMSNSNKAKGSGQDRLDSVQSETIVLSNMDDSMPAALAVDGDGVFDFDKNKDAKDDAEKLEAIKQAAVDREIQSLREESGIAGAPPGKKPGINPVTLLLRLLRTPERWLIKAWYKSPIRKTLHEKSEWYREFENAQEVRHRLENAYGGSTKPLDNAAHFIRNNILTTLVLTVLAGQLFVSYLSQPAVNRYTDRSKPVNTDDGGVEAAALAEKQIDAELLSSLNHCAVSNHLRKVVDGEQDRVLKNNVLAEISGFIQVYRDSELENWYASREAKRELAASQVQSALPRIRNYSEQVSQEIAQLVDEHTRTLGQLDEIDVTTKQGINQFIRIRSELVRLDDQIRYSPSITRTISMIDGQALRLKKIISGFSEDDPTGISRWAVTTSQQDLDSLSETIGTVVRRDVDANIVDLSLDNAETKLYRLQILSATLRDFGDLIAHLSEQSNHTAIKVAESQDSSNNRLRDLLGMQGHPDVNFLNYGNCLSDPNPSTTKLTIQQANTTGAVPSS